MPDESKQNPETTQSPESTESTDSTEVAELVGRLSGTAEEEPVDRRTRRRLLRRLGRLLAGRKRRAADAGEGRGRWMADVLIQVAPRIRVRDLDTLKRHHPGLSGEQLADALTRTASRATATVGAAGGALAVVEFVAPPLLLTAPAQLVAESLVVAAVELKLIAELHEVYGVQIPGGPMARTSAFLGAWARQRGVDPLKPGSMTLALGVAARSALRKRLMRTFGRQLTTLGPFLTGAIAGGTLNRAATRRLSDAVRDDLRRTVGVPAGRAALPETNGPAAIE